MATYWGKTYATEVGREMDLDDLKNSYKLNMTWDLCVGRTIAEVSDIYGRCYVTFTDGSLAVVIAGADWDGEPSVELKTETDDRDWETQRSQVMLSL